MRPRAYFIPITLFLLSLLYLSIGCDRYLVYLDDGDSNFAAYRILHGDIPYRDFMQAVTPSHFYLLAFLFKLFGPLLMVERIWQCVVWSLITVCLCLIGKKAAGPRAGFLSWLMGLALFGRLTPIAAGMPSGLLFGLLSAACLLEALEESRSWKFFASGITAGLAILFRDDIGLYAAGALLVFLCLLPAQKWSKAGAAFHYLSGILAAGALPAIYFLSKVPFRQLFFDLAAYPLTYYPRYSSLPYPPLFEGFGGPNYYGKLFYFYGTPAIYAAAAVFLFKNRREKGSFPYQTFLLCFLLGVFYYLGARLRPDITHLVPPYVPACVLFSALLARLAGPSKKWITAAALGLVLLFALPGFGVKMERLASKDPLRLDIPAAKGIRLSPRSSYEENEFKDYEKTLHYVQSVTRPGEKIFVTSTRNDRACYADPLFYFLAGRGSGTRYHNMYRGLAVQETVQSEIAGELEKNQVRCVVLREYCDLACKEPNESVRPSGVHTLDQYLKSRYSVAQQFGGNLVLMRKAEPIFATGSSDTRS